MKLSASDEDLRRLVAQPWWEWQKRMLVRPHVGQPETVVNVGESVLWVGDGVFLRMEQQSDYLPVPSDPATAGCLMDLYLKRYAAIAGHIPRQFIRHAAMERLPDYFNPDAFASPGDHLVAVLLEIDREQR